MRFSLNFDPGCGFVQQTKRVQKKDTGCEKKLYEQDKLR